MTRHELCHFWQSNRFGKFLLQLATSSTLTQRKNTDQVDDKSKLGEREKKRTEKNFKLENNKEAMTAIRYNQWSCL